MIHYACSNCRATLESPDSLTGNMDKCPKCGAVVRVPRPIVFWGRCIDLANAAWQNVRPVRATSIKYNCPTCSTPLESPAQLGGKEDTCPHCGSKSTVPQLRHQKAEQRQRQAALAQEQYKHEQEIEAERKRQTAKANPKTGVRHGTNGKRAKGLSNTRRHVLPPSDRRMLVRCPACKRRFSETAEACPKCGYKVSAATMASLRVKAVKGKRFGSLVAAVMLLLISAFVFFAANATSNEKSGFKPAPMGKEYQLKAYEKFRRGERLSDQEVADLANRDIYISASEIKEAANTCFACGSVLALPGIVILGYLILTRSRPSGPPSF